MKIRRPVTQAGDLLVTTVYDLKLDLLKNFFNAFETIEVVDKDHKKLLDRKNRRTISSQLRGVTPHFLWYPGA